MGKPEFGRTKYQALEIGLLQAQVLRKYLDRAVIPAPEPDQPDQNYLERIAEKEDLMNHLKTLENKPKNGRK